MWKPLTNVHFEDTKRDGTYRMGEAVEQLVEALLYQPESRGFDSRWRFLLP
jgi:hypothetical protein